MMSLFSVFDPVSFFGLHLNWLILMIVIFMIPVRYYSSGGGYINLWNDMCMSLMKMFSEISYPYYSGLVFMSVSVFMYLMFSNLLGLVPFVFTLTAHPCVTMGFGCIFWVSFFFMGWFKNFKYSAAHLVPEGSPFMLAPLMVLIESISHLIRPFTLSIRLAANMMAGHLIIGLLSSISSINFSWFLLSMFLQSMLLLLEFGVSIIQGFVFSILIVLYALDYY